jgi:hypothetical protein
LKTCYAESADGVHWSKPNLGLFSFEGSGSNIILQRSGAAPPYAATPLYTGANWTGVIPGECATGFFKDSNPHAAADATYKAVGESGHYGALLGFKSPDGIHWTPANGGNPILVADGEITEGKRHFFDSQNVVFWDDQRATYVMYFREYDGTRRIRTLTSTTFESWDYRKSERLIYPGLPDSTGDQRLLIAGKQNLYTNGAMLYERAPHITIGFPTYKSDYVMGEDGAVVPSVPRWDEPLFMSSRDGRTFRRSLEALIPRNTTARKEVYGNFMTRGLVALPGNDREYAIYAQEGDFIHGVGHMRMFTYRLDGFRSVRALEQGGEITTKPLVFAGNVLIINVATQQGGSVRVEMQDVAGKPVSGFALADCPPISGDAVAQQLTWTAGRSVIALAGKPIRLRFVLKDADLFSFRFAQAPEPSPQIR